MQCEYRIRGSSSNAARVCRIIFLSLHFGMAGSCLGQLRLELDFRKKIDSTQNYGTDTTAVYAFNVKSTDAEQLRGILEKLRASSIGIFGDASDPPILKDGFVKHFKNSPDLVLENCVLDIGIPLDFSHMRSLELVTCAISGKTRSIKFSRNTKVQILNCGLRDNTPPIELQFDEGLCEFLGTTRADLVKPVFRMDRVKVDTLQVSSRFDQFAAPELSKIFGTVQHLIIANYMLGTVRLNELSFVQQSIVFERCGLSADTVFAYGDIGSELTTPQLRFEKCIVAPRPKAQEALKK